MLGAALGTADASEAAVEASAVQAREHALADHGPERPRAFLEAVGVGPLVGLKVPLQRLVENRRLRMPRTIRGCLAVPAGRCPMTRSGRARPHERRPLGGGGWSHPPCVRPQIPPGHLPGQAGVISLHLFASRCRRAVRRPHRQRTPESLRFDARSRNRRQRSAANDEETWSALSDSNRRPFLQRGKLTLSRLVCERSAAAAGPTGFNVSCGRPSGGGRLRRPGGGERSGSRGAARGSRIRERRSCGRASARRGLRGRPSRPAFADP